MELNTYIQKLQKVANNPTDFVFKILVTNKTYVLAVPKRRLLESGTDANDLLITPSYAVQTVKRKNKKGQTTTHVTLKDTGRLYRSFKLIREGSIIDFTAPIDLKTGELADHYSGNELFGFSPTDSDEIFLEFIKPALIDLIEGDGNIDINF